MSQELSVRQKEIVDQATVLITEKGIQNLTIKRLAKKMGFSEPAIYRHFPGKTEILLAIIGLFEEKSSQSMHDHQMLDGSFSDSLKFMFTKHIGLFANNPTYATVIFSEELFRNDPQLIGKMQAIMNRNEQNILMLVDRAKHQGDIRQDIDGNGLTLMIMGGMRLLVKKWVLDDFSSNLETEISKLHETIIKLSTKG